MIDVDAGELRVELSDDEIAARLADWSPPAATLRERRAGEVRGARLVGERGSSHKALSRRARRSPSPARRRAPPPAQGPVRCSARFASSISVAHAGCRFDQARSVRSSANRGRGSPTCSSPCAPCSTRASTFRRPTSPPGARTLSIEASLADGRTVSLDDRGETPPLAHFPTALRGGDLVSITTGSPAGEAAHDVIQAALSVRPPPVSPSSAGSRPARPRSRASSSRSRSRSCFWLRTRTGIFGGSSGASPSTATRSSSPRTLRVSSASPRSTRSTWSRATRSA